MGSQQQAMGGATGRQNLFLLRHLGVGLQARDHRHQQRRSQRHGTGLSQRFGLGVRLFGQQRSGE